MLYLKETLEDGTIVLHNLETGEGLTKHTLLQVLKHMHRYPGKYEIVEENVKHPSDGIAPIDHLDVGDLLAQMEPQIAAIPYELDHSDFQRIAIALSKAFKARYGMPPRDVIRPSQNNPQLWASRKKAYPPCFIPEARRIVMEYCKDRVKLKQRVQQKDERLEKTNRKHYRGR